jgi:hypothetical protein
VARIILSNEEELLALQDDPIRFNDEILYPEKVRINNAYVKNRSFFLDLKIIIFTILGKRLKEEWAQGRLRKGEGEKGRNGEGEKGRWGDRARSEAE